MPPPASLRRTRLQQTVLLQAGGPAGPLDIAALAVWPLREPKSGRRYTIVRVDTRSGLRGYGECGPVMPRDVERARQAVVGLEASAYEVMWRRLEGAPSIRAGVDMALLDVLGRHAKAPVFQVLGGPTRFKARALAPLDGPAALERAQKLGYKAFAVKSPENEFRNAGKSYVQRTMTLMDRLRRAGGTDVDFVLDGGGGLAAGDAQVVAAELERFHLLWFDEPVRLSNLGAVRKIAGECVTPVGFGRTLRDAGEFQDLLREDAVDIVRPDLRVHGISQVRRIAALAETYYVAVAPYHEGGPLGTAAALHLAASLPNFFIQQIPAPGAAEDREMRAALVSPGVEEVKDGFAALPAGPGLGVTVNESALERYREGA